MSGLVQNYESARGVSARTQGVQMALSWFHDERERDDSLVSWLLFLVPLGVLVARRVLAPTLFVVSIAEYVPLDPIRWAAYAGIVVRELVFGKYDRKTFGGLALFAAMGVIAYQANYKSLIDVLVFAFAARDLDFKRIARFAFIELMVLLSLVVISSLVGMTPNVVFGASGVHGVRCTLGFGHPNTVMGYLLFASLLWVYLRDQKFGLVDAGLIALIIFGFFQATESRAALVVSVALILLMLVWRYGPESLRNPRVLFGFGVGAFALTVVLSIGLSLAYSPDIPWMQSLDTLLSGRLSSGHDALQEYGVTLFGQRMAFGRTARFDVASGEWLPDNGYLVVDNTWIRLLIHCGVLFTLAFAVLLAQAIVRAGRAGEWVLVIVFVCISIHAMAESATLSLNADAFLMLLAVSFGVRSDEARNRAYSRR